MKKIIIALLIVICSPVLKCQEKQDTLKLAKEYEIEYIRLCLNEYHNERHTAICLGFAGFAFTSGSYFVNDNISRYTFSIMGGLTSLAGFILILDAEKWIKRIAIKPSTTGLGVKVTFNKPKKKIIINDDLYR
jgi:hypothetical protein